MDEIKLLREYATRHSETAFETLVSRHIDFVYSTALRQVRNPHLAEEVTQAVFVILAQKAGRISDKVNLAGWLFKTTRFVVLAEIRASVKRQREQEAFMDSEIQQSAPNLLWERMSPMLDEALAQLGELDRCALLLRFFENKSLAEVGNSLGTGEDTARKRVTRALEKVRKFFVKRGVASTTAAIAGLISVNSVQAAPVALTKTISIAAMGKGAAVGTSILGLVTDASQLMAWAKLKIAFAVGLASILASVSTIVTVEKIASAREGSIWTEENLYQLPPLLIVRPSSEKLEKSYRRNGERFKGVKEPVTILLEAAYDFSPSRMIFSEKIPADNFDFISTVPHGQAALQSEIQKQLKLVGQPATQTLDCLLLRVKSRNAPGIQPANGLNYVRTKLAKGEVELTSCSFADLSRILESILGRPVLDRTQFDGPFNISFQWNPRDQSLDSINSALLNQLGLELEPSRETMKVLVLTKAK
jgi:uncharacterized protein (TIGR03435 family)